MTNASPGLLGWYGAAGKVEIEVHTFFDLFDVIEERPGLFLGRKTLTGLFFFFQGYTVAMRAYRNEFVAFGDSLLGFGRYLAEEIGKEKNEHRAWHVLLLDACDGDEEEAFDLFYRYLSEYKQIQISQQPGPEVL